MARLNIPRRSPSTDSLYRNPTPPTSQRRNRAAGTSENSHSIDSPEPSLSSDKENRYDAAIQPAKSTNKFKNPMPINQNSHQHGNKRRRMDSRETPISELLSQYPRSESGNERFFNPLQDVDLRRGLRAQMRTHTRELHDRKNEFLPSDLSRLIRQEDRVMDEVRQTSDATLDSRFLLEATDVALKKTTSLALGNGTIGVDVDEFVSKCILFMRHGGRVDLGGEEPSMTQSTQRRDRRQARARSEDEAEEGDALAWEVLGEKACFPANRRPAVPSFLLGPLSVEKRVRNTQRSARQRRDPQVAVSRPQELQAADLERNENSNITKVCHALRVHLDKTLTEGEAGVDAEASENMTEGEARAVFKRHDLASNYEVSLFRFVINPKSFGQTVENLFHVSFLVKDGFVRLSFDDDGLPTIRTDQPRAVNEQHEAGAARHQAIFTLDYRTWQKLIVAMDITNSLIPHRNDEAEQVTAAGWYG